MLGKIYPNHQFLIIIHKINLLDFAKQLRKAPVGFIIRFCPFFLMTSANFSGNISVKLCKLIKPRTCVHKAQNEPSRSSLKKSSHFLALNKDKWKKRKKYWNYRKWLDFNWVRNCACPFLPALLAPCARTFWSCSSMYNYRYTSRCIMRPQLLKPVQDRRHWWHGPHLLMEPWTDREERMHVCTTEMRKVTWTSTFHVIWY
jgi:hypothetical protein